MESSSPPGVRDIALVGKLPGIQLSWNTRICEPSPTLHIIPFLMTCLALSKLCQANDLVELLASNTVLDMSQFYLRVQPNKGF